MSILLCAATSAELEPFRDFILEDHPEVELLLTGVGALETAYSLARAVFQNKPQLIIQAGIGGSFDNNARLGEVVAVKKDTVADLGVMENGRFHSVFSMGLTNPDEFPFEKGWLVNRSPILEQIKLRKVTSITVNEITTSGDRISHYHLSGAETESMEGAAMHFVALKENIPFIQLRALSNYMGERDKSKWELQLAITELNKEIINLIRSIQ